MLDLNLEYQTRAGRKVSDLRRINSKVYPVVGTVTGSDGSQCVCSWTESGAAYLPHGEHPNDLVPVKKRIKGSVNIYRAGSLLMCGRLVYSTREKADNVFRDVVGFTDRVACIEIDVEEGHGL